MDINPKTPESKSDQIVLTVLRPARVILKDGSVFTADAYSSNPIGFYVIGFWDQESLKKIPEGVEIPADGKSKMTLLLWSEIRAVSFLVEETKPADNKEESSEKPQG